MDTLKGFFGIKTAAQKAAEKQAAMAQVAQGRGAEADAAQIAGQQSAADRIARAAGTRSLAYQGNATGLASTLGG